MKTFSTTLLLLSTATVMAQRADGDMLAGMTAMRKDDHAAAEQAFSRAVEAEPNNARTWYYRGVNRLGDGDLGGAMQDFDKAIVLQPDDAHSLLRRAEVRSRLGAEQSATADLQRVLAVRPTGPAAEHALLHLGHFAMAKNDLVAAKSYYDRLVEIAPYNAFGWCDRGIVLSSMHMDDAALADLDRAVELDPTLDQAHVQRAIILFRMDRKQDGCEALHQAHDLGDKSVAEMMVIYCE
ncbi:MAG TPA: tetratricopeptide repeat protein [Flavobacteriales bacterium]|nr:tetratricopeptide repeat protein [Flavobacteriales bacterium]